MTIDQMIAQIESVQCIRKVWRCSAGWGLCFVYEEQPERSRLTRAEYELQGTVEAYYDTLEECVIAEYVVHVLRQPRPGRGQVCLDPDETTYASG